MTVREVKEAIDFLVSAQRYRTFKSNFFFFLHSFFLEGCRSSSSRLSHNISRSTNTDCISLVRSPQTVPTKILGIIKPSCSWSSNWPLPTHFSIKRLLEKPFLRHSAYMTKISTLKSI